MLGYPPPPTTTAHNLSVQPDILQVEFSADKMSRTERPHSGPSNKAEKKTEGTKGRNQASFIRAILQGGGVWAGGSSAGWVGLKLCTCTCTCPSLIPRVSWVGLLSHLLSLVTGALPGCLLVPLSALSLCRWQVCRWQFFRWRTFFLFHFKTVHPLLHRAIRAGR